MPTRRRPAKVLILSSEAMIAALLGLLLETRAYEPAFAQPGERPEDAVRRVRPLWVILLDGSLDVARSDLFYTRAQRQGVQVMLWSPARESPEVASLARERGLLSFTLPITGAELTALLEQATSRKDRRGTGDDRRAAPVADAGEGLLFTDGHGQRWHVYDRRTGERRTEARGSEDRADATAGDREFYRAFVNEGGEEWRYGLAIGESTDTTITTLERQLARAVRVTEA